MDRSGKRKSLETANENQKQRGLTNRMRRLTLDFKRRISYSLKSPKDKSPRGSKEDLKHEDFWADAPSLAPPPDAQGGVSGDSAESLTSLVEQLTPGYLGAKKQNSSRASYQSWDTSRDSDSSFHRASFCSSPASVYDGPFIAKAVVTKDYTPSPYDDDALTLSVGDTIDIISMNTTGTWTGVLNNKIGTFKFINVDVTKEEPTKQRKRTKSANVRRRHSHRSKPKTTEDLLNRLHLEKYVSVFLLNGYDLEHFKEIEEEDLIDLQINSAEDRAKLLTAAELLLDDDDNVNANETVERLKKPTPRDSGCYGSNEHLENKDSTKQVQMAVTISLADTAASSPQSKTKDMKISQKASPLNARKESSDVANRSGKKLPSRFVYTDKKNGPKSPKMAKPSSLKAKLFQSKPQKSYVKELRLSISQSDDKPLSNSCDALIEPSAMENVEHEKRKAESLPHLADDVFDDKLVKQNRLAKNKTVSTVAKDRTSKKFSDSNVDYGSSTFWQKVTLRPKFATLPRPPSSEKRNTILDPLGDSVGSSRVQSIIETFQGVGGRMSFFKSNHSPADNKEKHKTLSHLSRNKNTSASAKQAGPAKSKKPIPLMDEPSAEACTVINRKLSVEKINLSNEPYTQKGGACCIPSALVLRYVVETRLDVGEVAAAMELNRIQKLRAEKKAYVHNRYLAETCSSEDPPNYSSVQDWLVSLGLPLYTEMLAKAGYSQLEQVCKLTEAEMEQCGIYDNSHRQRLSAACNNLLKHLKKFGIV